AAGSTEAAGVVPAVASPPTGDGLVHCPEGSRYAVCTSHWLPVSHSHVARTPPVGSGVTVGWRPWCASLERGTAVDQAAPGARVAAYTTWVRVPVCRHTTVVLPSGSTATRGLSAS